MAAFLQRMKFRMRGFCAGVNISGKKKSSAVWILLLLSMVANIPTTQGQQIRFDKLTVADGLSSNSVYSILQDSKGILWFGTLDGLSKYDGYQFTVYRHDASKENSLSNNRITLIFEDRGGRLWLYDEFTSYMIRYTPLLEEFKTYELKPVGGVDFEVPQSIYEDNGVLRIRSIKGKTLRYDDKKDTFQLDDHSMPPLPDSLAQFDQQQMLTAFDKFLIQIKSPYSSLTVQPRKIFRSSDGRYWIATKLEGLFSAMRIQNEFKFTSHLHTDNKDEKVNSEDIHDIYEDHSNVVWIGTKNSGLYRYSRHKYKFDHVSSIETKEGTVELGTLRAIVEDPQKRIWVGTNEQGLIRIDPSLKTGKVYKPKPDGTSALGHRFIRSMWIDEHQQLWVGHYGGYSMYQPDVDDFKPFFPKPDHGEELRVYDIKGDGHQGVWMAGWDLVVHYDLISRKYRFISRVSADTGLDMDNIRTLLLNDDGSLKLVAGEKGISIFNNSTRKFEKVHYSTSDPKGLPSANIFDVLKDRSGNIWLATTDGLCLFDPGTLVCENYTVNNGLPSNLIYCLTEDQQGYLWFSSTKGIGRLDPQTRTFRNYDATDGLQSNEFTENAVCQNEKGFIFFGGINGLNIFHPQDVPESREPPRMAITSIKVFDQPLAETKLLTQEQIHQRTKRGEPIIFSSDQRSVSIEFVAYHYVNPEKNRFAYRLKGFDEEWIYRDANIRFANYTNLDPGEYTFMLKGANSDGTWSNPVKLIILIEKPFYATWWFILLISTLLLSSGIIAYRWRIAALKKQQSLKAIQLEAELNSLKSQVNPHFLFNTLNNIYSLCQVNSKNAAPMVGKISEMMRYMIYDCNAPRVTLQKEIEYLQNYVELNQLKSHRKLNITFEVVGDIGQLMIAPLLLINFVENGFKHGDITLNDRGFINIKLKATDTTVIFEMRNSYRELHQGKAVQKGIGIENAKHRLALLYPNKHRLTLEKNGHVFTVELVLDTDV